MGTSGAPVAGASEIFAVASAFAAFAALAGAGSCASARPGRDDVIDPKHHDRRVRRRGNRLRSDADRLDHVLLLHIGDLAGEDVDPRGLVALLVLFPKLDEDVNRVEAGVLREGARDNLDGVRERSIRTPLTPADSGRQLTQGERALVIPPPAAAQA